MVIENAPNSFFEHLNSSLFQPLKSPNSVIAFASGAHSLYVRSPFGCIFSPYYLYDLPIFKIPPSASLKVLSHL